MCTHNNLASTPIYKGYRKASLPTPLISENLSFSSRRDKKEVEQTPEPSKLFAKYHTVSRSRIAKRSLVYNGPKVIGGIDTDSFLSTPGYSDRAKQTYLQQCFHTTKVLGEGSFGRVYKCTDKAEGIEYAVKVSELYNSRAVEEVHKHELLKPHPNCVKFYKAWEECKSLYIQMELCDESLADFVRRCSDKINEYENWRILHHCLSGLGHLHSNELLHMDIKPDNIFRCSTNDNIVYKLGDFGLAVTVSDLNKTEIIEGDSKYLAPELLDKRCDEKADIFSLGISLFEIMAEVELPNNGELWHALRNGDLPPTTGYSDSLRYIITVMIDKDPDKRPNVPQLLNNKVVKCYSWVNYFKDWRDFLKSKGNSVISSILGNPETRPTEKEEDVLEGMEDLEDEDEDEEKDMSDQITPIIVKRLKESHTPLPSPNLSGINYPAAHLLTSLHESPKAWPGSPHLSPVQSTTHSLLGLSNKLESSTPNKSMFIANDSGSDLEEFVFGKPSLLKRNLLDSFADDGMSDDELPDAAEVWQGQVNNFMQDQQRQINDELEDSF